MPRLSIVVPFLGNETLLHATLLSVLENQDDSIEVLVVHNGSYHDPFKLLSHEVIDVETDEHAGMVAAINQGILVSSSPYIQVLLPGTVVSESWSTTPIDTLDQDPLVSGVILSQVDRQRGERCCGFDMTALPRRVSLPKGRFRGSATPSINATIFRKKSLRLLEGLLETESVETSEIELGLAMRTLGLEAVYCDESAVDVTLMQTASSQGAYARGQTYGRIALAYSKIEASGVVLSSLMGRLGHLAGGLMSPSSVAERLGWVIGLTDSLLVSKIAQRIERSSEVIEAQQREAAFDHLVPYRSAA